MTESDRGDLGANPDRKSGLWAERLGHLNADWLATIVAGVITVLAVAGVLPKIPW